MAFSKSNFFWQYFSLHYEHAVFQNSDHLTTNEYGIKMVLHYILPLTDAQFHPDSKLVFET